MDTVIDSESLQVRQAEFAKQFKLTLDEYLRIVRICNASEVVIILELMKTTKHRSSYRQRMHLQVRRWLDNGIGRPLSPAQFEALKPTWPVYLTLPR